MQNISSTLELKDAIILLEADQAVKGKLLKEQFFITYETLKPVNLIEHALHDISTSPYLIDNILSTAMGIASGFLTNKIFVGRSGNIIRNLMGTLLQFSVTNVVARNPSAVKSLGEIIIHFLLRKKGANPSKQ